MPHLLFVRTPVTRGTCKYHLTFCKRHQGCPAALCRVVTIIADIYFTDKIMLEATYTNAWLI